MYGLSIFVSLVEADFISIYLRMLGSSFCLEVL